MVGHAGSCANEPVVGHSRSASSIRVVSVSTGGGLGSGTDWRVAFETALNGALAPLQGEVPDAEQTAGLAVAAARAAGEAERVRAARATVLA